jgi:hypothetical protein
MDCCSNKLNVYIPPKFIIWNTNLQYDDDDDDAWILVFEKLLGPEGWAPMKELSVLIKWTPDLSLIFFQSVGSLWPRRGFSPEPNDYLSLPASRII